MDVKYPVQCLLLRREIDRDTCFDIHMLLLDGAPAWTVPQEVLDTPDYAAVCRGCPYHREE